MKPKEEIKIKNKITGEVLLETLADLEHKQWIHWTKYFLRHHHYKNFRKRWKKQTETSYLELSEKEKEPDRVWAKKVIQVIKGK